MGLCKWCVKQPALDFSGYCSTKCIEFMQHYLKEASCGNEECGISTAIDDETLTFGSGELDDFGFWEHPCLTCANAWKAKHLNDKVWPKE